MRVPHATGDVPLHRAPARHQQVRAAGDPGVTIADFQFTPATITLNQGDTITWTNDGPSAHTASARDGSFDTGILQKGQSGSHTFTQAGTFAYYCKIHPFMHGTIVVQGQASPATPSGTSTNASPSSPGSQHTSSTSNNQTLPMTGANVIGILLSGGLLVGAGLWLRRAGVGGSLPTEPED